MPHTGELKHRVALQVGTTTNSGSFSEPTTTWATSRTVWAKVEPIRGREQMEHGIAEAEVDYRVWVRWSRSISPDAQMRVQWTRDGNTRTFDVLSAVEMGAAKEWLELMCKERRVSG